MGKDQVSAGSDIGDLRDWWLQELLAMLPTARVGRKTADYRLTAGRDSARIAPRSSGSISEVGQLDIADELQRLVRQGRGGRRPDVELFLESGRYLERQLAPFRLPARRAREMAALDLQASTPLDPADAVILFAKDDRARQGQRYFVVRRQTLAPLLAAIESAPARIAGVSMLTYNGPVELDPAGYRSMTRHPRRGAIVAMLVKTGLLACVIGAAATFAHAQWRYGEGSQELDATIAALDVDVKAVRALSEQRKQELQRIESVRQQKRQAVPLVRIWEEMTRVIPDDTWLSDLSVAGDKIVFTGLSKSAVGLIALLDASPLFSDPTFTTPVARAPGTEAERFTIEMKLQR